MYGLVGYYRMELMIEMEIKYDLIILYCFYKA